jgi:hypothetical protein
VIDPSEHARPPEGDGGDGGKPKDSAENAEQGSPCASQDRRRVGLPGLDGADVGFERLRR